MPRILHSTTTFPYEPRLEPSCLTPGGHEARARSCSRWLAPLIAFALISCGGGGSSNATTNPVTNPTPTISSLSPASASAGAAALTMTVNGAGFVSSSTVQWNGTALTTTFVNANQLNASVPATDLASAGSSAVTVLSPTPGGGTSSSLTFTVSSTSSGPAISSISPTMIATGSAATTITVHGSGFTSASTVRWNSTALATTFVSTSQLTAQVPASDLASATSASITVLTGSSASNAMSLIVGTAGSMALHVSGNHFVDASGATVQLRGANLSVLEFWLIEGGSAATPWGGQPNGNTSQLPDFTLMSSNWSMNAVRIPLNEASWLGMTCTDMGGAYNRAAGTSVIADPAGNYQSTVAAAVAAANAAGLYVILDLHWAAPGNICPDGQNAFADADNSLNFWSSVAALFKNNPAVVFEAFNEPMPYWYASSGSIWNLWSSTSNPAGSFNQLILYGTTYQTAYTWNATSMQDIVNTIRATGATNVILIAGESWSGDLSGWLTSGSATVHDTLSPAQIGAVWHAYPSATSGTNNPAGSGYNYTTTGYLTPANQTGFPSSGPSPVVAQTLGVSAGPVFGQITGILNAGYPVIITEFGDQDVTAAASGAALSTAAPFAAEVLQFADSPGASNGAQVSYMAWSFNVNGNPMWTLLHAYPNTTAIPSPGFGTYVQAHYQCRAAGTANCP